MNVIVFGGTGFIGGHVVEQLQSAGHEVTVAARQLSDTTFLEKVGVRVVRLDFADVSAIEKSIQGNEVVYNCTADTSVNPHANAEAAVEITLAGTLVAAAAMAGASRFVQLSTIIVYDFLSNDPMNEAYISVPEYPIQALAMERERVVRETGALHGIETVILRPASTIGVRDKKSFFARLFFAHTHNQYPMIGNGSTRVSLVDARDVGRAMAWLGKYTKPAGDNGVYLVKGFDTTWAALKTEIDNASGRVANSLSIPDGLTEKQMTQFQLTPFAVKTFTINRLWDDSKLRDMGFRTMFSLRQAVVEEVTDLLARATG